MEYGKVHSGKNGIRYYVAKGGETIADVSSATGIGKDVIKKQNPAVEYGKGLSRGAIIMLDFGNKTTEVKKKSPLEGVIKTASTLKETVKEIKKEQDGKGKNDGSTSNNTSGKTSSGNSDSQTEKKKNIAEKLKEYSEKIKNAEYDYEEGAKSAERKYGDSINKLKDTLHSRYNGIKNSMASQKISESSIAENERAKAQKDYGTSVKEKSDELNEKLNALKTKKERTVSAQKEKIKNLQQQ